jgi:DNA-binding NarL/FixJ family response regulator
VAGTALIGLGLSNTEIASHIHVSLSTAKTHVGRLLMKLGARDRAQLVIAAYDTGLVSTPRLSGPTPPPGGTG